MNLKFFVATALLVIAGSSQAALTYGNNLVVNGDAESGVTGWSGYADYGTIQSVDYGSNWVLPTQPGPGDRGSHLFAGLGQYAVGYQTLDFGTAAAQDTAYSLSGWLGGWADQDDNALFYVQFFDEFDNELGSATIGPVMAQDRANQTGLQYRESDGLMPTGTRSMSFWLSMERLVSGDNDGYADNLSFILHAPEDTAVPEPGIALTFLLSLGVLGWVRRRNRGGV